MQGAQTRAAAGWGSKAAVSGRSIVAAKPGAAGSDGQRPKRGAAAQAAGGNVAGVLDAIERSPLGMKLEANHPGLGMLAQSMVRAGNALRRLGGGAFARPGEDQPPPRLPPRLRLPGGQRPTAERSARTHSSNTHCCPRVLLLSPPRPPTLLLP